MLNMEYSAITVLHRKIKKTARHWVAIDDHPQHVIATLVASESEIENMPFHLRIQPALFLMRVGISSEI